MPLGSAPANPTISAVLPLKKTSLEASKSLINIVFLAEGFSSSSAFFAAADTILVQLEDTSTFPRSDVSRVLFYRYWYPTSGDYDDGPDDGNSGTHFTLLGTTVGSAGLLNLDLDALNRVTGAVFLDSKDIPENELRACLAENGVGLSTTILMVLLPDPGGGTAPRGRAVRYRDTVVPDGLTPPPPSVTEAEFDFIIAEAGGNAHLLLMRQVGEALGLVPEWTVPASAPDGAVYERPDSQRGKHEVGPNLIYIPADGSEPTYRRSLDAIVRTPGLLGLDRVQTGEPVDTSVVSGRYVEKLYEGGGGYRHEFYRTAPDCIMRRRLPHEYSGTGADPVRLAAAPADLGFCPACEACLAPLLLDSSRYRYITFNRQHNKFEQIRWGNARRGQSFAEALDTPTSHSVRTRPANSSAGKHYFVFEMEMTNADGLIFRDIFNERDASGTFTALHRPIAEELRFRDLRVKIRRPDGSSQVRAIDLAAAAAAGRVETFYGTNGTLRQDNLWHHGFLYRAVVNLNDEVEVTVEQSVCFRGPNNDFDPTKAVVAIKVYPELCFSYRSLDNETVVESFHGCVWQNVNPRSEPMMHPEGGDHDHPSTIPDNPNGILTTWFGEINGRDNRTWILERTRHNIASLWSLGASPFMPLFLDNLLNAPTLAFYSGIFAYWLPQEESVPRPDPNVPPPANAQRQKTEMEIVAVRHPAQARVGRPTDGTYKWLSRTDQTTTDGKIVVTRETREGQYDNVHNHGWMGVARNPGSMSGAEMVRRMAPVCGQACVHLHVRWLFGAASLNAFANFSLLSPWDYWGWGDDPLTAEPHQCKAKPLVPPNQRVRIAVTNPDRDRANAGNPAAMTAVLPGTNLVHGVRVPANLNNTNRGVWYDVDVEGSITENQKHVILEQGWGYAADHATPENGYYCVTIKWLRDTAYRFGYNDYVGRWFAAGDDDFEQVMMFIYDCWTYHLHDGVQIPQGDWRNSHASDPLIPSSGQAPYNDLSMEQL